MKHRIGQYRLVDDVECKTTPDGYEIFREAADRLNIKPESIHTANGRPVSAYWVGNSIIVEY